jgi:hypothetical protein
MNGITAMPNKSSPTPRVDANDTELALWMLERMRKSERFLGVIKAARVAGSRDVLDTPDYVELHRDRLKKLFQSGSGDDAPLSSASAAKVAAIMKRDLLSSPEEVLEKALDAYLELNPRGLDGIDAERQSVFDQARDEIEGRTSGEFKPGFASGLAATVREELVRQADHSIDRSQGQER